MSSNNGHEAALKHPPKSQPFEVAVARKLKNRSSTLMDTFLKFDLDGDGYVTRSDLKKSLHNILGIDLTKDQMNAIFTRFAYFDESMDTTENDQQLASTGKHHGIRYTDFVRYIHDTALDMPLGSDDYGSSLQLHVTDDPNLDSIVPPKDAVSDELRHALRRKLMARVSKRSGGGNGIDTQLFLMMDADRSGKVSPKQFQDWIASVGMVLTESQCKTILGSHYHPTGIDLHEFVQVFEGLSTSSEYAAKPMEWESVDRKESRGRRLAEKAVVETASTHLVDAIKLCADDAKSDQTMVQAIAQQIFRKRYTLLKAFDKYDSNKDGKLEPKDLCEALKEIGLDISLDRAISLVRKFDMDEDGKLNRSDFATMISSTNQPPMPTEKKPKQKESVSSIMMQRMSLVEDKIGHEEEARQAEIARKLDVADIDAILVFRRAIQAEIALASRSFEKLDKDKSRTLSAQELKAGFDNLGIKVTLEQIQNIISKFDDDHSGRLNYVQFIKLLSASLD